MSRRVAGLGSVFPVTFSLGEALGLPGFVSEAGGVLPGCSRGLLPFHGVPWVGRLQGILSAGCSAAQPFFGFPSIFRSLKVSVLSSPPWQMPGHDADWHGNASAIEPGAEQSLGLGACAACCLLQIGCVRSSARLRVGF